MDGINLFSYLMDQVEKSDIAIGQLAAANQNVKLNLYYTPTMLTENSLIFSKKLMTKWWEQGYDYAKLKHDNDVLEAKINGKHQIPKPKFKVEK